MRLERLIAQILIHNKQTLATAESCTGGLLAHTLTNVPGSSAFFMLGIVAYGNAAKTKILKIPASLIKKHGAVSAEAAKGMAIGAQGILNTDYGLGITGIAGPGGGTKTKPVGLTYIAVTDGHRTIVQRFQFKGTRLRNKNQAVAAALRILRQMLP
ncbi:MAG: CinA family protein [Candidatus Omnitrophica bacterium]|nr:CinA family protein [Candidatus Omnitrophota bacterium]